MTVESLKSELQQVLDNDLILRKEFNELKRSLSDYRNQLIMRDEDCKRLQVTIDVLNTKLVVMERDNNNYKAELTSFKELRSTIKDQLQSKQEEIEQRLTEIQSLKDDLNSLASGYEQRINEIKNETEAEINNAKDSFNTQLSEMNAVSAYKEQAIKEEYENRINDLTTSLADKEQNFEVNFKEQVADITGKHEAEVNALKSAYELKINTLTNGSKEEIDSLISTNQKTISDLQNRLETEKQNIESQYVGEISNLRSAIEEQRQTLTSNFNHQLETLKAEFEAKEERLISNYELQISALSNQISSSTNELTQSFEKQITELTATHQNTIDESNKLHDNKVTSLINEYEAKLTVTLIHSNSQNTKYNEELDKVRSENETSLQHIQDLTASIAEKNNQISGFGTQILELENQLLIEVTKFNDLNAEFDEFKARASLSNSEVICDLNSQIESLLNNHSIEIDLLNKQIENQNNEIANLGLILETTTNQLSSNEGNFEERNLELQQAQLKLNELELRLTSSQSEFDNQLTLLNERNNKNLSDKNLEFEKLLNENNNLISEIEEAQSSIENREAELNLLRSELEEVKIISAGRAEDFKEILANKNFEITNLEATKAALSQELVYSKMETLNLENQIQNAVQTNELVDDLNSQINQLMNEKDGFIAELNLLNETVKGLNANILGLNERLVSYETEISDTRAKVSSEEQDAFIDRLFKQIDGLNDERLVLLEEKEQMANQLLKMNDVISSISQQVDSENINVTDLNNHRKNVILASNSNDQQERSQMKEQINDLVREIDKCIALLSA